MPILTLQHIGKHFGAQEILQDVSFRLERSDHAALVGANGAGKSTLLRIIAGLEEPDTGEVIRSRDLRIAYLEQEPSFPPEETLFAAMMATFAEALAAQERLKAIEGAESLTSEGLEEYGRLQAIVEHAGYDLQSRVERVLLGLGLPADLWHTRMGQLSGGQRTRANLARTLLTDADLLLLDEPTNHLDIPAVEWLEGYLRDWKRAFLLVAHDRYLLDRVTARTFELSGRQVSVYDAPYLRYLTLRAERQERQQEEYEAQQKEIARTEEFIRRYGAGQRSKEARGRQKRLDRLERIERPEDAGMVQLSLKGPKRSGDIVLETRDLAAGYGDRPLVQRAQPLVVRRGDRIALIGPNGSGKTTLLRTLVGAQPQLAGTVRWGANTSIAYYSQTLEGLNPANTILDEIRRSRPLGEEEARSWLGRFLFTGDDVFKTVESLSGGERSRVALARLIREEANVLVLDEPTNHLDIASRDALQTVLAAFPGTLLFVSHDRALIDALARELWVLRDGTLVRYTGTYSDLASGRARLLDGTETHPHREVKGEAPEARVRRLEEEAAGLAERLAAVGTTLAIAQLTEMVEQYDRVAAELAEAQGQWVNVVRRSMRNGREKGSRARAASDSRDRSPAARQR